MCGAALDPERVESLPNDLHQESAFTGRQLEREEVSSFDSRLSNVELLRQTDDVVGAVLGEGLDTDLSTRHQHLDDRRTADPRRGDAGPTDQLDILRA